MAPTIAIRRLAVLAAAAAILPMASGCGGTEKKADDYSYVNLGGSAPQPKPGTRLTFDDPAWIGPHSPGAEWARGRRASKDLTGPVGATVLDMYPLPKSYWNHFMNASIFAGRTPIVVVAEFDFRETRVQATQWEQPSAPTPPLLAALPDGTPVEFVDNMSYNAVTYERTNCVGRKVPAFDDPPGNQRFIGCEIFAAKDGHLPTEVIYTGVGTEQVIFAKRSTYAKHPIVWTPKRTTQG